MIVCENCGNEIREGRKHDPDGEKLECLIIDMETERPTGFSHRRPPKNLYKK